MMAAHYRLDNLVAIVDRNALQITGSTQDVCHLAPLDKKFAAFGFCGATLRWQQFGGFTAVK